MADQFQHISKKTNVVDLANRFQTCPICDERFERPAYPNVSGCCDKCFLLICNVLGDNTGRYWERLTDILSQRLFENLPEPQQDALLEKMFNMVEQNSDPHLP